MISIHFRSKLCIVNVVAVKICPVGDVNFFSTKKARSAVTQVGKQPSSTLRHLATQVTGPCLYSVKVTGLQKKKRFTCVDPLFKMLSGIELLYPGADTVKSFCSSSAHTHTP